MSPIAAVYFDGQDSLRHEVGLLIGGGKVKLVGRDLELEFPARKVRIAPRLGDTPRWLYLPGGGACVIAHNDAVDRFARERPFTRLLNRLEARPAYAVVAIALVVGLLWLLIDRGLPPAVEYVAEKIPRGAEATLGEETLDALDDEWLKPTQLPRDRVARLRPKFDALAKAAGDNGPLQLEFRASPIGANAFALPGGTIVVTDDLVKLSRNDDEVLSVLAHEIGHVHYRHTMRQLLQGSATALIIAAVTGDVASTTSLAASAPALLLQTKYSRDYEREADAFAIDLLQKTGIGPQHFAAILARLEAKEHGRGGPAFLSTHPPTAEREALARAAAGESAQEEDGSDEAVERLAQAQPRRPQLAIIDPDQRRLADLLEKRDFSALDRELDGIRLAFERDPGAVGPLEDAFRVFEKLPGASYAALGDWVKAAPSSYNARVARGAFFYSRGAEERGEQKFSETSSERIDAMDVFFDRSLYDLERSLDLSPKPYLSRRYMMSIMLYTGSREELEENYLEAVELAPASVGARLAYMRALEPRWGGSYEEMERFLAESRPVLQPKDAARLAARIPAYRGFENIQRKRFAQASEDLSAAIQLDANAQYLCERGYVKAELRDNDGAWADVASGLAKARDNRYCLRLATSRAGAIVVGRPEEVQRVMSMVIEVDPMSGAAYRHRGYAYERQGDAALAFSDYLVAAKLGDAWAQTRVGKAYWSGTGVKRDPEEALAWLEKAAKQGDDQAKTTLAEARKALGRPPQ